MNDVKSYLNPAEKKMNDAVLFLEDVLSHLRAGKANVSILDVVKVDYYGSKVPVSQVANVNTPDARTIAITPGTKACSRLWKKPFSTPTSASLPKTTAR